MSSNSDERTNPQHDLTPAEIDDLDRLEAIAQHGLRPYVQVGSALAEIRDRHLYRASHPSFGSYIRDRWAVNDLTGELPSPSTPCEALAQACEQTLSALGGNDRMRIEIRVAVQDEDDLGSPAGVQRFDPAETAPPVNGGLVPTLRWLLTQATGTVGLIAHQLETRAADIDDGAREQLRDDVLLLDDELAMVKALLMELPDWDDELTRLLDDALPPFEADPEPDDED